MPTGSPSDEVQPESVSGESVPGETDAAIHSALACPDAGEPRQLTLSDIADDSPYSVEAFAFLQRGLTHTVAREHGADGPADGDGTRHVHGRALCMGLRDLALEEFGMMAGLVLGRWNVTRTADFGEMVYLLVAHGVLAVSKDDRPEDFHDVYDFAAAF
ncbi:MAG: Minf_1886 family protein [Planctomycetota bacterium]